MKTPTIYDMYGRPIKKSLLKNEQAESNLAGIRNYFNFHTAVEFSAQKLARLLKASGEGDLFAQAELFENMEERDTHIFSEMSKRKKAITSVNFEILPYDDSSKAVDIAEFVQNVLDSITMVDFKLDQSNSFEDVIFNISDAIGKGLSILEIIYDISESSYIIKQIKHRPIDWFMFNPDNPTELRLIDGTYNGEELIPGKWIIHFHPAKSGSPYRAPLYRILAWLFLFRNYSVKSWVQFVEIFGIPLRLGKYPEGSSEENKEILMKAVSNIAQDAAAIIPEGMEIEFKDAVRGPGDPHKKLLDWSEKEISKTILGATLTSNNHTVGSYALGKIHNQVRLDILASDIKLISSTINNQIIKPLVQLNFGKSAPIPYIQFDIPKPDERELMLEIITKIAQTGMTDIPVWWIREVLNIPSPSEDDITLQDLINQNKTLNLQKKSKLALNKPEFTKNQQIIETLVENSLKIAGSPHADKIIDIVKNSNSFEEITEKLAKSLPDLDNDKFNEILNQAIFTAELFGRANFNES